METAAYRLFYDNIHDFKTTAVHIESEINRYGISSKSEEEVPGKKGRKSRDMWESMKIVSHFNLGIALELMLKLLLFLNKMPNPLDHSLTQLHDAIPSRFRKQLEITFQDSRSVLPHGFQLVAFINTENSNAPLSPPNQDVTTLKGFLKYLDEDAMLWQKRYSWEHVDKGRYRHYLSDISVFVEFIDRVMRDIPRY